MTKYRGYQIEKQNGTRDTWFNVILDGVILHRAVTSHSAMGWIDTQFASYSSR